MLLPTSPQDYYGGTHLEAERFIQSALDALSAHISILDEEGYILSVNSAWRTFGDNNGYSSPNYGIGTSYLEVCDTATARRSSDAPIVARGIRDILAGRISEFELEYPCHSPTQRRWFVVRISRFEWYKRVRLIVAHQNITELKLVQLELLQNQRRTESVIESVNNGIITVDNKGQILTANRACARIFGGEQEALLKRTLADIIAEPFEGRSTFRKLNGERGHEITGRKLDGTPFPMYLSLNELKMDDGSVFTCVIQDITWRRQLEEDRIERERMTIALEKERELRGLKNRFLSMMSHELRTPLASISLSYDMLKKYGHLSTPEEKMQALDNIRTQVELLSEMVGDVMTLSRSEGENLQISRQDADLITYCRDIVEEFQFNYHKTHAIEFYCEERTLRAPIDRKLLRRAITNLLSNAVKYTPENGEVSVTLSREASFAIITVQDNGIGVPEADIPRLFEPFHRASNVDNIPGTGLGLPITKQLIELHDGKITANSVEGQGTTFIITLPIV